MKHGLATGVRRIPTRWAWFTGGVVAMPLTGVTALVWAIPWIGLGLFAAVIVLLKRYRGSASLNETRAWAIAAWLLTMGTAYVLVVIVEAPPGGALASEPVVSLPVAFALLFVLSGAIAAACHEVARRYLQTTRPMSDLNPTPRS
jgi:hypothetical protein